MTKHILSALAAVASLAGCGGSLTGNPTDSAFATPSASGNLSRATGGRTGSSFSDLTGNGYGYQVGSVSNDGLQGFAGIVPGAAVEDAPINGFAEMNGTFEVGLIDFIFQNGTQVSGQTTFDRGDITLFVDFTNNRVTGGGTGLGGGLSTNFVLDNNALEVDGRIEDGALTGTVTYDGVSGPLRGLVGANETIGAFHGHTDNQVHAGGFIAN